MMGREAILKVHAREIRLAADVDLDIPETGAINADGVAVIIGNRNYAEHNPDVPDVEFALRDDEYPIAIGLHDVGFVDASDLDVRLRVVHAADETAGDGGGGVAESAPVIVAGFLEADEGDVRVVPASAVALEAVGAQREAGFDADFAKALDAALAATKKAVITAIHEADDDGNDSTVGDPEWLPLLETTPPYPDHPSGWNCNAGAHGGALREFFGTDDIAYEIISPDFPEPRQYTSISQGLQEGIELRILEGIHFRNGDEQGVEAGLMAAALAAERLAPVSTD